MSATTDTMLASVRSALSQWWALIGVATASVTVFNLLVKLFDLGLADAVAAAVAWYRAVVTEPILAALSALSLRLPAWSVDLALTWLIVGGVVLRAALPLRTASLRSSVPEVFLKAPLGRFVNWLFVARAGLPVLCLYALLFWPHLVLAFVQQPHVSEDYSGWITPNTRFLPGEKYHFDLRIVLATQTAALCACLAAWLLLNVLLQAAG